MNIVSIFIIGVLILILLYESIFNYMQAKTNRKLQIQIASLTVENIELKENLEECKQTIKVLQHENNI